MTKKRNCNLDLLRMFSMFIIVFLHSIDHSGVLEAEKMHGDSVYMYVRLTYFLCIACVNLFVMISGYFMITSKFRLSKLAVLWIEILFYSFVIRLVFIALGLKELSLSSVISCFVPIFTGRYWFLTIYFGMYLISPFLNKLIKSLNKVEHTTLVVILFFLFSLWSSLPPSYSGMNSGGGWGLAWFCVLYTTASWFRLYYIPQKKPLKFFLGYIIIGIIISLGVVGFDKLSIEVPKSILMHWYEYSSAPAFIISILVFVGFLNLNLKSDKVSKVITFIAPSTLGVYLIHAHADFSPWSWEFLNLPAQMNEWYFPLIQIFAVVSIYVVCIIIDIIRRSVFYKLEKSNFLFSVCNLIQNTLKNIFKNICREN